MTMRMKPPSSMRVIFSQKGPLAADACAERQQTR